MHGKSTVNKVGVTTDIRPRKNSLRIRDAHSEELNEVSLLIREAYMEYEHSFPAEHWKFYLENIMDVRSRLSDSELIVAELNRQLVGAVTLYLDASSSSQEQWPKGWAGVRLLAVRPAYRGQGIGRALMEECIYRCRKQNIKTIGLHTAIIIIMSVARRMYEDMGFVRAPEYDFQPRPRTVVMAYRLRL
jgi:GNAT superfamily N-acetyltransferase